MLMTTRRARVGQSATSARPSSHGNGSQRERIRAAAVQLFTRYGYAGTSMKRLASELNMTPGNLYNHYPKKEAILYEVLSHELESLLERSLMIVAEHPEPAARIHALAYDLLLEDLRNPMAAFVGRHGVNGLTASGREEISKMMTEVRQIWIEAVQAGVADGSFDAPDPKISTLNILTLCSSTSSWYNPRGEYSSEEVAEQTANAALRILGYAGANAARHSDSTASS
jgi:AcrR family transcriptional regulator